MKRSGRLTRRIPLRRRTRLRPRSARRAARDDGYADARQDTFDRAGGRCQAHATDGCAGTAQQVHHIAGRGGDDPHRPGNLLAVCHRCHTWIHDHPAEAYEAGWMESRTRPIGTLIARSDL